MDINTLSYWHKTATKKDFPPLKSDLETDTLIIGSGITGITSAYCLARRGIKPILIEAGDLCDGTTGNTTGKITIQHGIIYSHLLEKYGHDKAQQYSESHTQALNFIQNVVKEHSIDCQLAFNTAYLYATTKDEKLMLDKEYQAAKELGIEADFQQKFDFPPGNFGVLGFKNQAVFHPVRYINKLAQCAVDHGAQIYCSTKAVKIDDGELITVICENDLTIKARHLIMATQYPIYDGPNIFYTRLYAKRDYGIAVSTQKDWPDGSYINVGQPTRSLRTHIEGDDRILIAVGESHPTARGPEMNEHYDALINFAQSITEVKEVLAKWSAQDYDTPDQISYIGRISSGSNIYTATGFGRWGLSSGTLAGNMITELILDRGTKYEQLYSREREDYSSSLGKVITEVTDSVGELIKSKLEGFEELEGLNRGESRIISYQGHRAGAYRDFEDNVIILDISCTHMTTELNFNDAEKTWDCPAHGGRYSVEGKLLEGPPKHSLQLLYKGKYTDLF